MNTPVLNLGKNIEISTNAISCGMTLNTSVPKVLTPSRDINFGVRALWDHTNYVGVILYGMLLELCSTFDTFISLEATAPETINSFMSEYAFSCYALDNMDGYDWVHTPFISEEYELPNILDKIYTVTFKDKVLAFLFYGEEGVNIYCADMPPLCIKVDQSELPDVGDTEMIGVLWYYSTIILLHKVGIWATDTKFGSYSAMTPMNLPCNISIEEFDGLQDVENEWVDLFGIDSFRAIISKEK